MDSSKTRKVIAAGMIGNALEWARDPGPGAVRNRKRTALSHYAPHRGIRTPRAFLANGATRAPFIRCQRYRFIRVAILDAVTVLECGRPLVPQQVAAQAEGGFAMGVGYALFEYLSLYEDGPGSGTWNLDRYRVPRASDLPIWNFEIDVLPPLGPSDVPKGIGELVMIPAAPAILNAIADAIGKRLDSLPVTPDKIKAALA
jgi:Molybdopterin cofactor-binding domain